MALVTVQQRLEQIAQHQLPLRFDAHAQLPEGMLPVVGSPLQGRTGYVSEVILPHSTIGPIFGSLHEYDDEKLGEIFARVSGNPANFPLFVKYDDGTPKVGTRYLDCHAISDGGIYYFLHPTREMEQGTVFADTLMKEQ